jgi:hypothetical protein
MTDEQVTEEVNEEAKPETQEAMWERTMQTSAPITKEELRGEENAKEDSPVLPDRALVAPEIAEYFQTHKETAPDQTAAAVAKLQTRLEELAAPPPEEPSEMQAVLDKLAALESRELDRQQKADEDQEQADEDARLLTQREGIVGNIRAEPEKFAGLLALSLEDSVYNTVVQEKGARSEYDVASKAEEEVWDLYEKLHAIKTKDATSEPEKSSETPKPITTLTPDLTADDEPWSLAKAMEKGSKQAQAELWERVHANQ